MWRKAFYQSGVRNLRTEVRKHESILKSFVLYTLNIMHRQNMCESSVLRREFGSKWRKWQENVEISLSNWIICNTRYTFLFSTYRVHLSHRTGSRRIPTVDPNGHIPCNLLLYSKRTFLITLNLKIFYDCACQTLALNYSLARCQSTEDSRQNS